VTIRPTTSYVPVVAGLFAAAAIAWLVVVVQTGGMESAPGTMGLGAASFLGLWTVMMAAMMLPALAPLGILYAGEGRGRTARTCSLAAGYLVAWAVFGGLALAVSVAARDLADRNDSAATWVGAALLVAAGAYQLSPLKNRSLGVCRSPLHVLMRTGAYRGPLRHVRAGIYHGAYCIGCCWSLMVALIALGVMDLRWMVAFAVVITLERVWRHGKHVAIAAGIGLIALGLLAPSHPGIVPGLHRSPMSMESM
jgi:predicted metal-binding membrane protein